MNIAIWFFSGLNFYLSCFSYAEKYFIDSAILTAFEGRELQPEFILEHLLKIARLLDLSDEVGRYSFFICLTLFDVNYCHNFP